MVRYQEKPPPVALSRFVECLWSLTPSPGAGSQYLHRVYPDGATDIVISSGRAVVFGPTTRVRTTPVDGRLVGFRIRPGAAKAVLGVSPGELPERPLPLITICGDRSLEIADCLTAEHEPLSVLRPLARFLIHRMNSAPDLDPAVLAAIDRIHDNSAHSMRVLARHSGLSERQLRRRFEVHLGLGIKEYARVTRFQRLLDAIRHTKRRPRPDQPSWAGLAYDHGFSDQAHLVREVRALSGLTPTELSQTV